MKPYKFAIVGGGPTGLWLACELALMRVQVARKTDRPFKAPGLHARTMEMIEHRGILDRFANGRPTIPFLNFGMLPMHLRRIDFPHPYALVIPQARVEAILEERAKELGADIRRGHEANNLQQNGKNVRVGVRTREGASEISAKFLAGCDGGHSTVRKQLGLSIARNAGSIPKHT